MKKRVLAVLMGALVLSGTISSGVLAEKNNDKNDGKKTEVYTFIAASLSNSMNDVKEEFEKENPDITIVYNADSSGTLQKQIEEGAKCDVFFSAANKQMKALLEKNQIKKDSVKNIVENKVVLIKPKDGKTKVTSFENITEAKNIALAGESVPAGQYAREVFKNLGIMDKVNKMEINEGKNVTEVLANVSEGSNEVGVVYATDAASVKDKVDIICEAPKDALKTPVLYPVGIVENKEADDAEKAATEKFMEFLTSDKGIAILEKHGFTGYKEEKSKDNQKDNKDDKKEENVEKENK